MNSKSEKTRPVYFKHCKSRDIYKWNDFHSFKYGIHLNLCELIFFSLYFLTPVGGGSECTALSPPSIPRLRWDPWARHRTPNCSPGAAAYMAAHCPGVFTVCVFTCVCVCTWMGKYRAQIPSMGNHTWPHVMSLSLFTVILIF